MNDDRDTDDFWITEFATDDPQNDRQYGGVWPWIIAAVIAAAAGLFALLQ